jgi:uncharacterized protein (TIGR02453 family)
MAGKQAKGAAAKGEAGDRFRGFPPDALGFLRAVAFHQDRAWFAENRAIYETALRAPFAAFVTALAGELARRRLPLTGDPARALFRLHRDVRFSKDKRPFKTATGCVLTRDGAKASPGLLYVHLDPEGCFVGAGFWQPEPGHLEALRRRALRTPRAWQTMVGRLAEAALALDTEDAMMRLPRGFETQGDSPVAEALRFRNFIVRRPLSEAAMGRPDLVARCADFAAQAMPLLRWGWAALAKREAGR